MILRIEARNPPLRALERSQNTDLAHRRPVMSSQRRLETGVFAPRHRSPARCRVFLARSATTAAVARGFSVDAITPAGARNRNSLLVASFKPLRHQRVHPISRHQHVEQIRSARRLHVNRRHRDVVQLAALAERSPRPAAGNRAAAAAPGRGPYAAKAPSTPPSDAITLPARIRHQEHRVRRGNPATTTRSRYPGWWPGRACRTQRAHPTCSPSMRLTEFSSSARASHSDA